MAKMKAVGAFQALPVTHVNALADVEVEKPIPGPRDVLVQVQAISVNPIDTKMRMRIQGQQMDPVVLGWDVAGVVESVGTECQWFQPGDEVFYAGANTRPGANSEFHVVDERLVGHKPNRLTHSEAAALPLTGVTAWEALFDRMRIPFDAERNRGKTILVIGAAGGVGSIATQLAKLAGLTVIGTASRPETQRWVNHYGADYLINHYDSLRPQLEELEISQVDYVLCLNNTDAHWNGMADVIAPQGTICSIVDNRDPLNLALLKPKSVTFVWEFMFTRSANQTDDMVRQHEILEEMSRLVDEGKLRTTLTEVVSPINAENLRKVHAALESGRTIGKIVLEDFSSSVMD
jgi:NADPH:quinone reductase